MAMQGTRRSCVKEVLLQLLTLTVESCSNMVTYFQTVVRDAQASEMWEEMTGYFSEHPFLSLAVTMLVVACGIPTLAFLSFAVITVIMTFIGFIFIEGTLLTVGSVMLCGFLLSIVFVVLTMSSVLALSYFSFVQVCKMMNCHTLTSVQNVLFQNTPPKNHGSVQNGNLEGEQNLQNAHTVD